LFKIILDKLEIDVTLMPRVRLPTFFFCR
jgi:hypothetical protein